MTAAWPTALCFLLTVASVSAVKGQSYQGGLRGAARDGGGGALPAVALTLKSEETNVARTTVANEAGEYVFEKVEPGRYRLTASLTGFKKLDRLGIVIETQRQITLDLTLQVGDLTESVVIAGDVPLLETSNPSTGQVLTKQILTDLPNPGRNPFSLAAVAPNVIPVGNPTFNRQQDQSGSSAVSLAGGPVRGNNYLLDGVPISDLSNRAIIIPSIEAIQELKLQVNTYDAEVGRTGGGVFNVAAKSGGNQWHGGAFGFLRPSALRANTFFANRAGIAKPEAGYKLYGGSLGGPVAIPKIYRGKDRTFFWASFEGYRMQSFQTETLTVPTEGERAGDFSRTRNAAGQLVAIYDPLTTRPDPNNPGKFIRDPFPGNAIPAGRLDPVGAKLAQFFPKPTGPGDPVTGRNNYAATSVLDDRADQQTLKLEHAFSGRYQAAGTYAHYGSREPLADFYRLISNPGGSLFLRAVHAMAVNNIITLTPSTLLSVRYGYNTFRDDQATTSAGFDPAQLGFASSFTQDIAFKKFPRINLAGAYGSPSQGALGSGAPAERRWYSHNFLVGLSRLVGRHGLKAGWDYRQLSVDFTQTGQASGDFTFTKAFTQADPNVASANSGNELASLLLGYPAGGSAQLARPLSVLVNYYAGYLHDDFRWSQKLTVNLGLRYEYEQGLHERKDQLTVGFDRNVPSPLQVPGLGLKGGLLYAGVDGNPRQQTRPSKARFGPRLGFAYTLNDRTTVRAGYGIFWAPMLFPTDPTVSGVGALGFSAVTDYVASTDGVTPAGKLADPFPNGLVQPTGNALGLLSNIGQTVSFVDQERKSAHVQQYSLEVQRELPGEVALTVGYIGSRGTHLQVGGPSNFAININQLTPELLKLGSELQRLVPNPFFGVVTTGFLSGATVARGQLIRPFPQFGNVLMLGSSGGNSFYNSVTVKAQKRYSRGLAFLTSYTFSKLLDNIFGQANAYTTSSNIVNSYNLAAEYGLSRIDTPHRFLLSGTYELPFGKGKAFLSGGDLLDKFVGGWQVNAVGTYQSGFPLTITQNVNNANATNLAQRPDAVPGVSAATPGPASKRVDAYLNPAAFSAAAPFTFGNLSRTIGVRSPAQKNWDFGIVKTTTVKESFKAQIRLEALNAFNSPVFNAPNTAFGNANFGRITSQANFPRIVQLGLRLLW